jgi:hypothetical protein
MEILWRCPFKKETVRKSRGLIASHLSYYMCTKGKI